MCENVRIFLSELDKNIVTFKQFNNIVKAFYLNIIIIV